MHIRAQTHTLTPAVNTEALPPSNISSSSSSVVAFPAGEEREKGKGAGLMTKATMEPSNVFVGVVVTH